MITFSSALTVPNSRIVIYKKVSYDNDEEIIITYSTALPVQNSRIIIYKGP